MSFSYNDVKNDALIDLKGTGKAAYGDTLMNKLVIDSVLIARKITARKCPELIWTAKTINLLVDNAGPYEIANDLETPVKLLNEDGEQIDLNNSYRGEFSVSNRDMTPDGNWIEGYAPAQLFFNATPTEALAWTLYYIASIARTTDTTGNVPLPDFFREALTAWVVKFAAGTQEYSTIDEDQRIQLMESLVGDILIKRRPKMQLIIKGVDF